MTNEPAKATSDPKEVETEQQMVDRHGAEIHEIIAEHQTKMLHKEPTEAAAVRRDCSNAIAAACRRHTQEANDRSRAGGAVASTDEIKEQAKATRDNPGKPAASAYDGTPRTPGSAAGG